MDMVLWAVPCCIIGARFYYVLFYLDLYRNTDGSLDWGAMFRIWDGGLAIYGAVIAGVLVALVYTKRHKLPFFAMGDVAVMGLLLGQIIGRWANFINREAFGGETTLPWRMKLWVSQYTSIEVHPTFFYESFWNLIGLLLSCSSCPRAVGSTGRTPGSISCGTAWAAAGSRACGPTACTSSTGSCSDRESGCLRR